MVSTIGGSITAGAASMAPVGRDTCSIGWRMSLAVSIPQVGHIGGVPRRYWGCPQNLDARRLDLATEGTDEVSLFVCPPYQTLT